MLKLAASALGVSLLLATPASADGWGRPGWGGGWGGPPVGWVGGGGGCCSPCGGGCGAAFAPVVSYQPVVVVGGCGGWGGGYGWSAGYGRGYSTGYGPAYAHRGRGTGVARASYGSSYGFGPGVRVTRVTHVGVGARPGMVRAGFRR